MVCSILPGVALTWFSRGMCLWLFKYTGDPLANECTSHIYSGSGHHVDVWGTGSLYSCLLHRCALDSCSAYRSLMKRMEAQYKEQISFLDTHKSLNSILLGLAETTLSYIWLFNWRLTRWSTYCQNNVCTSHLSPVSGLFAINADQL